MLGRASVAVAHPGPRTGPAHLDRPTGTCLAPVAWSATAANGGGSQGRVWQRGRMANADRAEPGAVRGADGTDAGPGSAQGWRDPAHVDEYVGRVARLPPRLAGEAVLVEAAAAATPPCARPGVRRRSAGRAGARGPAVGDRGGGRRLVAAHAGPGPPPLRRRPTRRGPRAATCSTRSGPSGRSTWSCRASPSTTCDRRAQAVAVRGGGGPAASRRPVRQPRGGGLGHARAARHLPGAPSASRPTTPRTGWSTSRPSWGGCAGRASSRSTACGAGAASPCWSACRAGRRPRG